MIANDEAEIGEVVRRRLFEDLGDERARRKVARSCADWCFERSVRLPSEWLAVDSARTARKAKEFLRGRFEACYPFHPATLSVFQRKWRALPQFQKTRGALAIAGLRRATPDLLLREGKADHVHACLDRVMACGHA